jgi:hypothetical protein
LTTWTALTDTQLAQNKPATQLVVRAGMRDNLLAVLEGDASAPKMAYQWLADFVTGSAILAKSDAQTNSGAVATPTMVKEIMVPRPGTITVSFDLASTVGGVGSGNASGRIYVNGTAVGTSHTLGTGIGFTTFTQNITVAAGDLVQLFTWDATSINAAFSRNFRLLGAYCSQFIVNL